MYEQLIYQNHLGETLEFGKNGMFVNANELHDYSWNYSTENNKISYFERGIVKKKVPIVIACTDEAVGVARINELMEYAEKDVLTKQKGKIIIGDYYLECYITGSQKSKYSAHRGFICATLTVISDSASWVKETTKSFANAGTGVDGLNFPHDFPYDYTGKASIKELENTGFTSSEFKMIIHGEVTNPAIYIGEHLYEVTCVVARNEYLTIDSRYKTITLTENNGTVVNEFKNRNKSSYIFEKIPAGTQSVSWDGEFVFDVTLYEERSEPKWT